MDKLRILAVDDNIVNLATIEQELRDKYEVIPMSSGRRAIKFLFKEKVDLILLDVQMPVMDGIETLKEIRAREDGLTIPVIFLTAKKDKATVIEGSKLGIMDYIVKPFNSDDLHARIENALKRKGTLPMEGEELYHRISSIIKAIKENKIKSAITQTEEIQGYQIDDDVAARVHTAKAKLKENDIESAERMLERILALLEKTTNIKSKSVKLSISLGDLNSRLLYILDDLENFKIQDANNKFDDLMRYELPKKVEAGVIEAKARLEEYDDGLAEEIIKSILDEI